MSSDAAQTLVIETAGRPISILRQKRQWSQTELARRCGLSRQYMNLVEASRVQPNVQIALRIADELGCSVEELFKSGMPETQRALVVQLAETGVPPESRLHLARINERWVGHSADTMLTFGCGFAEADARLERRGSRHYAQVYRPADELEQNIAIAGCDPAMALLQGRLPGLAGRCFWINRGSARALQLLADGFVHAAGLHYAGASGEENLHHVAQFDPGGKWRVFRFSNWEQGWMLAPRVHASFRGPSDLTDKKIRFANREPGSGSRQWLDQEIGKLGIPGDAIRCYSQEYHSHWECARILQEGRADVAVGPRAAAAVFGLKFVPAIEVAFDLVVPKRHLDHPRMQALLQQLRSRDLRQQIGGLPGYQTQDTGVILNRTH